jgi:hypothetical protein
LLSLLLLLLVHHAPSCGCRWVLLLLLLTVALPSRLVQCQPSMNHHLHQEMLRLLLCVRQQQLCCCVLPL